MRYFRHLTIRTPSQSKEIRGLNQVRSESGGHVWAVDRWTLVERFLLLGTETGTIVPGQQKREKGSNANLEAAIAEDASRVLALIAEAGRSGRAVDEFPALFALAMTGAQGDDASRRAAYETMPQVARTAEHLFYFVSASDELRGWGRGLRKAVGNWYTEKSDDDLVYQLIKNQARFGWSHADVLRKAHVTPISSEQSVILKWAVGADYEGSNQFLNSVIQLRSMDSMIGAVELISQMDLPLHVIPRHMLTQPDVWNVLLPKMPLPAILENLGVLSALGLLSEKSANTELVCQRLTDADRLRASRVRPASIWMSYREYALGVSIPDSRCWEPTASVLDALEAAYRLARVNGRQTGCRFVISSGHAGSEAAGPRHSAIPSNEVKNLFASEFSLNGDEVFVMTSAGRCQLLQYEMGSGMVAGSGLMDIEQSDVDPAWPIIWAARNRVNIDLFILCQEHGSNRVLWELTQALASYREATGYPAKAAVVDLSARRDPDHVEFDPGILQVVGFDDSVPHALREFAAL
ncbi:TROVE domain-containing protein [Kamptonema cortianum]|nr:TROVE domain-containing protein [Geitlerinema splendidum]MDK3156852.1 TROVE domain-containing protein [Kamptonema cortianum]